MKHVLWGEKLRKLRAALTVAEFEAESLRFELAVARRELEQSGRKTAQFSAEASGLAEEVTRLTGALELAQNDGEKLRQVSSKLRDESDRAKQATFKFREERDQALAERDAQRHRANVAEEKLHAILGLVQEACQ
jgi:chromosome segregation ATPase